MWAQDARLWQTPEDRARLVLGLTEEREDLKLTFLLFGPQSEPSAFSRRGDMQGGHGRRSSRVDLGGLEWIVSLWEQMT